MDKCDKNCESCKNKTSCNLKNKTSSIKKIIAVGSGKGGVGKSLVSSLIATKLQKDGLKVGILDADITGASIPKIFGIKDKITTSKDGIIPITSKIGIKIVSINMFIENETDPIIWRGPLLSNTVIQFYKDTLWGDLDCLIIDMPPGTSDIVLTIYQSIPIDDVIIVTTPQELVSLIVEKSFNMARKMNKNVLGLVENMSYLQCGKCGNKIEIFGKSKTNDLAIKLKTKVIEKIPLDIELSKYIDNGKIEDYKNNLFKNLILD